MASPLELLNQASYDARRRGVTYMPQVRIPPPRRPGPPITPRLAPNPQAQIGQGGGGDWVTPNFGAIASYAPTPPQGGGGLQQDAVRGLGWVIGNPVTRTLLKPLSVLDYPRSAVNALVTEAAAELIQRTPGAAEKYPDLNTDFSWSDIWKNVKEHKGFGETLVAPVFGADNPHHDPWNIWVQRALGFAGDIATDPLMKLGSGVEAIAGAPARLGYGEKLLGAQEEVARQLASKQELAAKLPEILNVPGPTMGFGGAARQAMGSTLAGAEQEIPQLIERQGALGTAEDLDRLMRRGVASANPEQLAEMGLGQHALRWAGIELPGTERISRGVAAVTGPIKERISASALPRSMRALRTAIGEGGQDLSRAYERALTGRGSMGIEEAVRTVALDQAMREGGSTFRGFSTHAVRQLDDELSGMDGAEREAMYYAADQGAENAVSRMGPKMVAAAKQAGVDIPVIEGQPYVPHVMTREAFNFLDRMRQGKNALVDEFRRKIGITNEDLLEEGGFLQRRSFRPELQPDGTLKPVKFKIGDQEITIERGDLAELEDKLGGVLRSAGFEGKLYETDPVTAYKRYVIATERDVAKRYAAKKAVERGYKGFYRVAEGELGPAEYKPVVNQEILPRSAGEDVRQMPVSNPQAEPKETDLFKWVSDEEATARRNKEIARKAPRGKQALGRTPREIQAEYEALGQAERENIARGIDETAAAAWNPHRDAIAALKKEEQAAREQVAHAEQIGGQYRARVDQIDEAIAEADRNITTLQSRIGGITRQARRRVEVQSERMLDDLTKELETAMAERERLMTLYNEAKARAGSQLPAAERRAAVRAENEPIRQERKLRKALSSAKKKTEADRRWAERYLKGENIDPKTGRSRWLSQERIDSAQRRLDDPRLQRQYNGLLEERNNLAQERLRLQGEAIDHERRAQEALNKANLSSTSDAEADRLKEFAAEQRRQANAKAGQSERMIDAHNKVTQEIQRHTLNRDMDTVRRGAKQQREIDKFNRDLGLGKRVDVPAARRTERDADLALQDFLRQQEHEAQYQAAPPPATLTEHYERELPKANRTLEESTTTEMRAKQKRLREIEAKLKKNPEPTAREVNIGERKLIRHGTGDYELRVGEGELDRYKIEHIVVPASDSPWGRVDHWVVTFPGETSPDIAAASLHEARVAIDHDRNLKGLGELLRQHGETTANLTRERDEIRQWLSDHAIHGEQVAAAERTSKAAAEHTSRQIEMEQAQQALDHEALSKVNAKADLEQALKEPEPKWTDPEAEKRADFDARHAEWEARQKSAKSQLNKVKRQLRDMGDRVTKAQSAQNKLNELEAAAAREFENVPKAQRPPFFQALEERNAANVARAGDLQAMLADVARKVEPGAAEAVANERMAAAKLGRAAGHPGEMITEGAPGYAEPMAPVSAGAEETAAGVPTNVEGVMMQTARGSGEDVGAMPQIAAARQRIDELHAGIKMNEAEREVVEQAQAEWFAPYNEAIENQRVARANYKEIEQRAAGLKRPPSAVTMTEGKRGGRPFGSQLNLVEPGGPLEAKAAGNLAGVLGSPAYEAQPMHATIENINKIIAANPTGDDALMNRIEAEVGNHLTQLDKLTREYDLPAHQLKRIIKEAEKGTLAPVLTRQLKEGFAYMWEGGDIVIDKELKNIYFNVAKQLESKLFGRTFTMLTDFFKTYATLSPGFHVRNALSAIFMNSSEGVTMATQRDGVRLWRQFIEAKDPVAWMKGQDEAVQQAFRATFASGAGGQFMERGVSELRTGGLRASERVFANKATRLSQRIGADWVEGPVRLGLALDSTRGGMSTVDAINRITRVHFDYGQVSRFDEKAKRVIPFWTFMSRNVPLQFTQMWTKPRTYLKYQSFVRNMTMGVKPDPLIPSYITGGGGFDTGIRTPEWLQNLPVAKNIPFVKNLLPPAGMPVVLQPDLPHARLADDLNRMQQALSGNNPGQLLSNANPFFTAPFEYAMGKDFFTGKNYGAKDWSQAQGAGVPIAMLLSMVGGGKQGADGNWYLQDKSMNFLRSLIPPLDRQSRLAPGLTQANAKDSDRMLESYMRFMGMPTRTISKEQERSELARRYYRARDAAVEQAVTGG